MSTTHTDTLRTARTAFFAGGGFDESSYTAPWVTLHVGPVPIRFRNTRSRQRVVPLHDLHHALTGYVASWTGEMEIGAWEVASGCAARPVAWILNIGALALGAVAQPRRTLAAFARGRRSTNLYRDGAVAPEAIIDLPLDVARHRVGVAPTDVPVRAGDVAGLALAAVAGVAVWLSGFVALWLAASALKDAIESMRR